MERYKQWQLILILTLLFSLSSPMAHAESDFSFEPIDSYGFPPKLKLSKDGTVTFDGSISRTDRMTFSVENVRSVKSCKQSYFAILFDGSVLAWGVDRDERLGVGEDAIRIPYSDGQIVTSPAQVLNLEHVIQISCQRNSGYFYALKLDGTVVAWGNPKWAADGSYNDTAFVIKHPTPIKGLEDIVKIDADYEQLALKADGTVLGWYGLAEDDIYRVDTKGPPVVLKEKNPHNEKNILTNASDIAFPFILKADGTVSYVPANYLKSTFEDILPLTRFENIVDISSGSSQFSQLLLSGDGTVWRWTNYNTLGRNFVQVNHLENIEQIFESVNFNFAVTRDRTLMKWSEGITSKAEPEMIEDADNLQISKEIKINLNGKWVRIDGSTLLENGTTLVPLRTIAELLGATLSWDSASKLITLQKNGRDIQLFVDNPNVNFNEKTFILDAAPRLYQGHTVVPIRFIAEALECELRWDQGQSAIYITSRTRESRSREQ